MPDPLGPRSAVSDPLSTSSETSSTATKSPKRFEMLRTSIDIYVRLLSGLMTVIATRTRMATSARTIEIAYAPARSKAS